MNTNKLVDRMFRKVDNVVWDLMSGNVGFKSKDGIITINLNEATDMEAPNAEVTVNMFDDFGVTIPAFAQSIPLDTVTLGDLIFGATGPLGWVVKKNEKSYKLMKPDGTRSDWVPPKVQMLGFDSGVMVLRNLMNMFPGGAADLGNFQNSMLPMMMFMGDESEISDMLPMMLLMGQQNGGGNSNMFQTLMMMKMLGGGNNKPFSGGKFFN